MAIAEETVVAQLAGKTGVVTGGGTGIGRATALAMAKAGAAVVIGNRDATRGEEVVRLIEQAGGRAVFQKTDVGKPGDVKALIERAVGSSDGWTWRSTMPGWTGSRCRCTSRTSTGLRRCST